MLSDRCSCPVCLCLSVTLVYFTVLWPNGWTAQDETGMQVGHGPGHTVLNRDPAPPPPKGHSPPPQFLAHVRCG